MITTGRFRRPALGGIIVSLAILANPAGAFAASGWSPGVVIMASQPSTAPSAFAVNPSGTEVWVTVPPGTGGAIAEAAQRSLGGAWSPFATITSIHSVGLALVQSLSVSLSANNYAAAGWTFGSGVEIALRSPAGAWHAPVAFAPAGGASNLQVKLDAQGNGVAAWSRLTATASVVEAVAWTSGGTFGNVAQLSPSTQGAFLPDIAVNESGAAIVVWQAAAPLDNSNPNQIESATRPAGGSWGAVTAVSPVMPLTSSARVALDGSGGATVVYEQGSTYGIYAASRPAGGAWGSPKEIEPSNPSFAGQASVAADAAGNVTATWVVQDTTGGMSIRVATRPAGASWGAPVSVGQCSGGSTCVPHLAAARDGSIAVVGWAPAGGTTNNVAVRLGLGSWTPMAVGTGSARLTYVVATSARASAVWPVATGVKYHNALGQSDYQ
jgi:hypothetical protein